MFDRYKPPLGWGAGGINRGFTVHSSQPASGAFSGKTLRESSKVVVEHALLVARIQFPTQA